MRGYFGNEVLFGHAKTAAYLVFGVCDIADLMEAGRCAEAEDLTMLLLATAEQAATQEWQWGLAWLLTFSAEPPWARIRAHPPATGDLRGAGRLADPELLAAAVGHMKDMMAITEAQRKAFPAAGASAASSSVAQSGDSGGATTSRQQRRARPKAKAEAASAGGAQGQ